MWFEPGEQIDDVLWHGSGTTGVTGWTIKVLKDGELRSDITATVTEIGTGFYLGLCSGNQDLKIKEISS